MKKSNAYKLPWDIEIYHRAQEFALKNGIKWCRMNGNVLYSLRRPHYSILLRDDVAFRFRRWLNFLRSNK